MVFGSSVISRCLSIRVCGFLARENINDIDSFCILYQVQIITHPRELVLDKLEAVGRHIDARRKVEGKFSQSSFSATPETHLLRGLFEACRAKTPE